MKYKFCKFCKKEIPKESNHVLFCSKECARSNRIKQTSEWFNKYRITFCFSFKTYHEFEYLKKLAEKNNVKPGKICKLIVLKYLREKINKQKNKQKNKYGI
jgi:hypothetical protein